MKQLESLHGTADEQFQGWSCARSGECCQLAKTGREPWVWPIEIARITRALSKRRETVPPPRADGACRLLSPAGGCSVYADRPLGCRTFYCERGSGPARVSRETITQLMVRLERLSLELDPDVLNPRPLREGLDALSAPPAAPEVEPPLPSSATSGARDCRG